MGEEIRPVEVAPGCPVCKSPDVDVPEQAEPGTAITCKYCGHSAPHLIFFKAGEEATIG